VHSRLRSALPGREPVRIYCSGWLGDGDIGLLAQALGVGRLDWRRLDLLVGRVPDRVGVEFEAPGAVGLG